MGRVKREYKKKVFLFKAAYILLIFFLHNCVLERTVVAHTLLRHDGPYTIIMIGKKMDSGIAF